MAYEPRVESESSEREPFLRLSDRALPIPHLTERLLFVSFGTSANEWLLVEAAGVIHAAPRNLNHRKGSLFLGSPTEHYEILGTIGYVAFPTGVSTDVSRDIV